MDKNFLCIDLLGTFSEKELEDLTHFASCRYFNTDRYVTKLLQIVKKEVLGKRTFDEKVRMTVYRKVFNDPPVSKNKLDRKQQVSLNHKLNSLTRLAERYLSLEAQKNHPIHKCELLYPELLKRKQFKLYSRHVNRAKKQLHEQQVKSEQDYAQAFKIERSQIEYLYLNSKLAEKGTFREAMYYLDLSYLLNKLELHLSARNFQDLSVWEAYDANAITAVQPLLEQYATHPLLKIYLANIGLTETQEDAMHIRLLGLLDEYGSQIPIKLLKDFYISITNYFIKQILSGKLTYNRNMFELYKTMHEKKLLLDNGTMSSRTLKNIVTVSCQVAAFRWAAEVLEYYRPFIQKPVRASVYQFNLGAIAFYQKDYETAHNKFLLVQQVNTAYDINVRMLILKCLYEKGQKYNEPTVQAFRTAESYFKNHKALTSRNKKAYKNFIRILINLYRIRHGATKTTLVRLQEKLEKLEVNSDKRWLLEKMGELEA